MNAAAQRGSAVRREAVASAAINAAISAGFFVLVFGFSGPVPVKGMGNLAFDFLPQSAAIGLMASLVPCLLMRKAIMAGRIDAPAGPPGPGSITARSVRNAVVAAAMGAMVGAILWLVGPDLVGAPSAFAGKIAYGAILGSSVTFFELRKMLR